MATKQVTLWIDYKSPYAYLAEAPAYALERDYDCEVVWRPCTLEIPQFLGAVATRNPHQWRRVRYAYRDARRYANRRGDGLVIRGPERIFDSSIAHIGLLYAQEQGVFRAYNDDVFERFWKRELDIEDAGAVTAVLAEAGADATGFAGFLAGDGRRRLQALAAEAEALGVFGVPSFLVDDELYWGQDRVADVAAHLTPRPRRFAAGTAPRVTAYFDYKSPFAFLAHATACELEDAFAIAFDWRPYTLDIAAIQGDVGARDERQMRKLKYMFMDARRHGAERGLTIRGPKRIYDSTIANAAAYLAIRDGAFRRFSDRIYQAFFRRELELDDPAAIRAELAAAGVRADDFDGFLAGEGRERLAQDAADAEAAGVFGVPSFVLDGELFWGSDRLALLRRRLTALQAAAAPG